MTKQEAWKVLAGRVSRNNNLFLCVEIDVLLFEEAISSEVAERMRGDIERVREYASRRAPERCFYALWPSPHPERERFARMAARGHARDYVYPEGLLAFEGCW